VPLKDALDLLAARSVGIRFCVQARSEGLGDAILHAESVAGTEPFAVILPDDVVGDRSRRTTHLRELRHMTETFRELQQSHVLAVTTVSKTKMSRCGVAELPAQEVLPGVRPVNRLLEKPARISAPRGDNRLVGIAGRYVLHSEVFDALRMLKKSRQRPVELTHALEELRRAGRPVYAYEIGARRHDLGEAVGLTVQLFREIGSI
jgi:UTP--glucose-1-phosphate uridylyltransferase